jgi:hypothetical protein
MQISMPAYDQLQVSYTIVDNPDDHPIMLRVYRSDQKEYDRDDAQQIKVAEVELSKADSANGSHTVTISADGQYTFLFDQDIKATDQALRPDPTHEYVITTLDDDGALNPHDVYNTPQKEFRIWVVAAVTHGFNVSNDTEIPNNLSLLLTGNAYFNSTQTVGWVDDFTNTLVSEGHYDAAIMPPIHWENESNKNQPNPGRFYTQKWGHEMAMQLSADSFTDQLQGFDKDADVIDVHFIGHSRGSVVISQALMDLNDSNVGAPQNNIDAPRWIKTGFMMMTMLDPHPANNAFGLLSQNMNLGSSVRAAIGAFAVRRFQSIAEDPNVVVPSNVQIAQDYYQHSDNNIAALPGNENLVNLWGESPEQIDNQSGAAIQPFPSGPPIGHGEIVTTTYANILNQASLPVNPNPDSGKQLLFPMTLFKMGLRPFGVDDQFGAGVDPLIVTAQPPATVIAGTPFGLVVTAENENGTVNTSFDGPVTLSLNGSNPPDILGGDVTVFAVNGVATFTGLTVNQAGSGVQLVASSLTLPRVLTGPFTVTPPPAAAPEPSPPQPVSPAPRPLVPPPSQLGQVANQITHSTEHYQDFVTTAYQAYLGRSPDPGGLQAWITAMQAGLTDEQLEAKFIGSGEYIANHCGAGAGWIRGMYHDLLGRSPSDAEVDGWLQALQSGASPEAVAYGFAASGEREAIRVRQDYQTYLGRTPAQSEVDGWVSAFTAGLTNESLIAGFLGSGEYYNNSAKGNGDDPDWVNAATQDVLHRAATAGEMNTLLGELVPSNLLQVANQLTHSTEQYQDFVTQAYETYLGRAPDPNGLNAWVAAMQAGLTDEHLEAKFIGSGEYIANHGGAGAGWIRGLYHDLLGRTPSDAEVNGWLQALQSGTSHEAVAYGFAASGEREAIRVHDDYFQYLGRGASEAEVDGWVQRFTAGLTNESLIAGFLASQEFYDSASKGQGRSAAWVTSAALDLFHRELSSDEVQAWVADLT